MIIFFILFILTIFICSIPFGFIFLAMLHNQDPRTSGSRNIGMSNVWRLGGATVGILTLIGDLGKGYLCIWLAQDLPVFQLQILAIVALLSHCFSIFLSFQGGKGVATSGGVILSLSPIIFGSLLAIWIFTLFLSKRPGISSLTTAIAIVPLTAVCQPAFIWLYLIMAIIVALRHKKNIETFLQQKDTLPN